MNDRKTNRTKKKKEKNVKMTQNKNKELNEWKYIITFITTKSKAV